MTASGQEEPGQRPRGAAHTQGPLGLGLTGGRQEGQEVVGSRHHQESKLAPPNLVGWLGYHTLSVLTCSWVLLRQTEL